MEKIKRLINLMVIITIIFCVGKLNAQYDQQKVYTFLKEVFDRHDKNLHDMLLTELNHYIYTFPKSKHSADAQYLLGKVYDEKGATPEALASFLKIIYLYPESSHNSEWAELVSKIVVTEKDYEKQKDEILEIVDKKRTKIKIEDRYFDYLTLLKKLDQLGLDDWFLTSCLEFMKFYPADKRNDQVQLWIADIYVQQDNNNEAEVSYQKFCTLYPKSELLPECIFKRGALLYNKFKKNEQAIELLDSVVTEFPENIYAANALFLTARIKEKKLKDYQAAKADYRKLVDNYPTNSNVIDLLFTIAKINKDKLKNYLAAISVFNEIVDRDTTNYKSVEALEEVAIIYKKNLINYSKTAETYKRIADIYLYRDKAVDKLFKAGLICERKLKDNQKAITYYRILLDRYPKHKKAKDAEKRINKIEHKIKMWAENIAEKNSSDILKLDAN